MSVRLVAMQWAITERATAVRIVAFALLAAAILLVTLQAIHGFGGADVALNPQPDLPC